jgi:hypothetical protein
MRVTYLPQYLLNQHKVYQMMNIRLTKDRLLHHQLLWTNQPLPELITAAKQP